jgi:adenylosuccinate synthase
MFKQSPVQEVGNQLQEVGQEFGTTTGRRRRCGWLDLVVMKHSCLINGYDCLNLTKLDVLDGLSEIKVGVKYQVDGKELPGFPGSHFPPRLFSVNLLLIYVTANLELLSQVEVLYVTLPGWQSSISSTTKFEDLPDACKGYVGFVESFLDTPITWIGVGPGRESMIKK